MKEHGPVKKGWRPFNPILNCVLCLYRIGFGFTTIAKLTRVNKGLCRKWTVRAGITRPIRKFCKPLFIFGPKKVSVATKEKLRQMKARAEARKAVERTKAVYRRKFYAASMRMFCRKVRSAEEIQQRRLKVCQNAKAIWLAKKGDKEWRAKKAAQVKKWKARNPAKAKSIQKSWATRNKHRFKDYRKTQSRKPGVKLISNLRNRLRQFVSGKRIGSTEKLVGCKRSQLLTHIESQFTGGMAWGNYGTIWVIDHILPVASFSLADAVEQRRCFHWTNLRPLEKRENMVKRDKITHPQQSLLLGA